jgi:hypothetical protein
VADTDDDPDHGPDTDHDDPDADEGSHPEYDVDLRKRPDAYEIGRGVERGFKWQPYKDELLPLCDIKTLNGAEEAAAAIYERFEAYREAGEFPGMDLARKYLYSNSHILLLGVRDSN